MNRFVAAPKRLTAADVAAARLAIQRSIRQGIPTIADFCLVHLVLGRTIRCVAGAHATSKGRRAVSELVRMHRIRPDDRASTVAHVIRSARAMLRTEIHPDPEEIPARGLADLHRRLAPTSALVVPIHRDGIVFGALSLCYSDSGRSYTSRQVPSAQRLALRVADVLIPPSAIDAIGLRAAARHAGQDSAARRRVAARN